MTFTSIKDAESVKTVMHFCSLINRGRVNGSDLVLVSGCVKNIGNIVNIILLQNMVNGSNRVDFKYFEVGSVRVSLGNFRPDTSRVIGSNQGLSAVMFGAW